jgi:hypothetical protein
MSPFEALYGRKFIVPISWDNPMKNFTFGQDLLREMEQELIRIRNNLKASQDKKKIYTYSKRTHKEFKVGDHVYIRVNPKIISLRMGTCAKLSHR